MKATSIILGLALTSLAAVGQNYDAGEKIFKMNCSACHKMDTKLIGPALMNVVADQGEDWTKKWIKNNEELRKSGDAHANQIFEEYKKMVMPNYSYLTDTELSDVVTFLKDWNGKQAATASVTAAPADAQVAGEEAPQQTVEMSTTTNVVFVIALVAMLLVVITMITLLQAFKTLLQVKLPKAGNEENRSE